MTANYVWFVLRDDSNKVLGSICFDEDAIEGIEKYEDGTYTVNFLQYMANVDISEHKTLE